MREIQVSIDVFAAIWALRRLGEQSENDILRRILCEYPVVSESRRQTQREDATVRSQVRPAAHVERLHDQKKEGERSEPRALLERPGGKIAMGKIRWVDDVHQVLYELGGQASLHMIYKHVAARRLAAGRTVPKSLEATIRRTIEDYSSDSANFRGVDLFANVGRGEWAIRER
ncbi:MAG: hypothetical protein SNJ63_11310 [Sphingomonadaceae bacterium]